MKKSFLLLIFLFGLFIRQGAIPSFGQTPKTVDRALTKFAEEVVKSISKSKIKTDAKIAVTFFYFNSGYTDTVKTYLGVGLSKNFAHAVKNQVSDRKLSYKILFPQDANNALNGLMLAYFTPPNKLADENRFYTELLNNEKPEYYITAEYTLSSGCGELKIINAELVPDRFAATAGDISLPFENYSINITNVTERSELAHLNYEIVLKPAWVDYSNRLTAYPEAAYIMAYQSEKTTSGNEIQQVTTRLKNAAVDQLNAQVKLMTDQLKASNTSRQRATFNGLDVSLLHTEVYYDEMNRIVHLFCYADKKKTEAFYAKLSEIEKLLVQSKLAAAKKAVSNSDKQGALTNYLECLPMLARAEDAETIIAAINREWRNDEIQNLRKQVQDGINSIQKSGFTSVEELAAFLAGNIKAQTGTLESKISIENFTYGDKGIGSTFSAKLTSSLEVKLPLVAGFSVITSFAPDEKNYTLGGTYSEAGTDLKIFCILKDPYGNVVGAAEASLPQSILTADKLSWKPDNFENAVTNQEQIQQGIQGNGNLIIAMWTNKGAKNLIFKNGERMQITVRANKPCYIRIVDYTSTGDNFLLLDNMKITDEMINKNYTLPKTFECGEPFGAEVLQVFAQSEPFGPLQTRIVSGFNLILDDVAAINKSGRRAFKEVPEHAELKINLTSVEK